VPPRPVRLRDLMGSGISGRGSLVVGGPHLASHELEPALRVSVIVPVCNGGSDFVRCLQALGASTVTFPWELIVVDDGSSDASAEHARAAGARVLTTPRPRCGPAVARNIGATAARGDYLLFIDADVVVTPATVSAVAAEFDGDPTLAALFGSYDRQPSAPNFVSQYKNLFHHYVHQSSSPGVTTFWAGCGAVRAAVFRKVGGFDGGLYGRPSIEDIELGYRMTWAGHTVRLCHGIQVTHLKRWTAGSLLRTDVRDRGIPWVRLLLSERVFAMDLNLEIANRVSVALIYLLWASLLATVLWPPVAVGAVLMAIALLVINLPLYAFFRRERGLLFALAVIPWHWLYYTYNGVCCVVGLVLYLRARSAEAAPSPRADLSPAPAPVHVADGPFLAED
jgi:GT2 family glycosyltransferase